MAALPLVGRSTELARLDGLIGQAASGHGQVVVIAGEAGIGKTRLIEQVAAGAIKAGLAVVRGAAEEWQRSRPFGSIADSLGVNPDATDQRRADLARLLVGDGDREAGYPGHLRQAVEIEYQVIESFVGLVDQLWTEAPLALILENLHWADPSTLRCLRRLVRLAPQHPALVVLTTRPDQPSGAVDELMGDAELAGATQVLLGPIDQESVLDLAAAVLGGPVGPHLAAQLEGARGNPLFVTELVAVLDRQGSISKTAAGLWEIEDVATPASLPITILRRARLLPTDTLELLSLAAVLGSSFAVADLATLSHRPAVELVPSLRAALAAAVLEESGDRLAFRHDLIHAALYQDLPLSLRRSLHHEFGQALAAAGAPAYRVAEHLARGAERGDRQAVDWLARAGREAAPSAPQVAVQLLSQAIELAGDGARDLDALRVDLALVLMWSGRNLEGETLARQVLARADSATAAWLSVWLARSLGQRGESDEARVLAHRAQALEGLPERHRLVLQAIEAMLLVQLGRHQAAAELASAALDRARALGDRRAEAAALKPMVHVEADACRLAAAASHAAQLVAFSDLVPSSELTQAVPHFTAAMVLAEMDRLDDAQAMLLRGRVQSEQFGNRVGVVAYNFAQAGVAFWAGAWDNALADIATGIDVADQTMTGWRVDVASVRAMIAVHRGDLGRAAVDLAFIEERMAAHDPQYRPDWWALAKSMQLVATGRRDEALVVLVEAWQSAAANMLRTLPDLGPPLARLAGQLQDAARAKGVVEALRAVADLNPDVNRFAGAAHWCAGLIDGDASALLQAADLVRTGPRPLDKAMVCEDAAAALAHAGRLEEARALVGEAIVWYEELQAMGRIASAQARLRSLGVRLGRRGPRNRPVTGWRALTDTERRVVLLAAQHLSNREVAERLYLSRRTVETHVAHALTKLGCASRRELAMLAARHLEVAGGRI